MKHIRYIPAFLFSILGLTACDVHEFPDVPEKVDITVRLNYKMEYTNFTYWEHLYNGNGVSEVCKGESYECVREQGKMRYVIRAYPALDDQYVSPDYTHEFVFIKDISEGYDCEFSLDLLPGDYNIMVWSDMIEDSEDSHFHDVSDFAGISLQGSHQGNNDYRDAFRGSYRISVQADFIEREPITMNIAMQRPLAKYELIATDLAEFTGRVRNRSSIVDVEDYKVIFYYVGFMPNTYSLFTDKPVDSSTGVMFETELKSLEDNEVSVGFDYVFVNGTQSAVTLQVGVYDKNNTQLSLTDPIEIPLMRSHHTILRGEFLTSEASGGVSISPGYKGDHNLVFY